MAESESESEPKAPGWNQLALVGALLAAVVFLGAGAVNTAVHPDSRWSLGWVFVLVVVPGVAAGCIAGLGARLGVWIARISHESTLQGNAGVGARAIGAGVGGGLTGMLPFGSLVSMFEWTPHAGACMLLSMLVLFSVFAGYVMLGSRRASRSG
ncbi:hypothetical protein ACWGOE_03055 [Leucobacter chromiiresistens]